MSTVQDPRKTWLATRSLLSLIEDAISGAEIALFRLWLLSTCLSVSRGDGPFFCWLALLWCSLSPCSVSRLAVPKVRAFCGKVLSLSLFFFSLSLAIPQFELLSHIKPLRLPSGHSGLVFTISNAARASLFSPHLLVVDVSIWATSPLSVVVRHVICGFYLFIFPPGYVAL